jgi:hypothetical protein
MDRGGFFGADNMSFSMPFPIFNSGEEVLLDPTQLRLVLTDMLRYPDGIHISREEGVDANRPVIFGLDWSRCGLILPLVDRYKTRLGYN